ncbi:4-hydroxybenzoate octaprenyltransferase [Raoultella terrigena]|uniref:4-hydroxybenzoate octaprenyltransferase n=1 Tax=Raoultella terrigena TaxID=577 RepID=A0A3P8M3Q7_RAOTE|nr:4-hydroxybenzoate octaprenyltransferase [Raoultella terrigena]
MRAAGCVVNDYADRKFDGHVKRTARRPLPSGDVTEKEARVLFAVLVVLSFLLVLTLNTMTILLSVAALALAWVYPFMKRYTHLPQVVLGAAFGWSIPMAFSAVSESLPLSCWLMFLANILWAVAYDTQYAMVDRDDDLKIGIKSTAILFGEKRPPDYRHAADRGAGLNGGGRLAERTGLGILLVAVYRGGAVFLAAEADFPS